MTRLYSDTNIDVRLVIFNGEKLIFCSRDATAFKNEWKQKGVKQVISVFTNEDWDLDDTNKVILLNLPPLSVTVTQSLNAFSTASVVFSNSMGRFWKRKVSEKVSWDTWKTRSFFEGFEGDYEEAKNILLKELVKCEESDYYKNLFHYFKQPVSRVIPIENFTRPFLVVDFGNLIFIDAKDRDGSWRAIFTGYVESITESYESAKDRRLTLNCVGLARYFERVPLFPELGSGIFYDLILPDELKDEEKSFYKAFFSQYRHTGDIFKMDYTQYTNLKDLMNFILEIFRFRLGQVKIEEIEKVVSNLMRGLLSYGVGEKEKLKEMVRAISKVYEEYWKKEGVYKFPFYEDVSVYTGFSNLREKFYLPYGVKVGETIRTLNKSSIASVYVPAEFDLILEKGGEGLGYYETIFGKELAKQLEDKSLEIMEFARRLIGLSIMQTPFHPTEKKIIEVIRTFLKAFGLYFFEDGFGNFIMDFIRYNEIPTSPYAFYEDMRLNGEKYIFREEKDILSRSLTKDGSKVLTALYFHSLINIPNADLKQFLNELMSSGHAFAPPEFLLRFGYNVEVVQDVYLSWKINFDKIKELVKVLNEYATAILEQRNALKCFKMRLTTRHRPDLQVGRTIYLPSLEELWFIERITHSITLGSDFTTTLELSAGHGINYKLREPRIILLNKLSKFYKNCEYTDGMVETEYALPNCGIVWVNGMDFPAEIKPGILLGPAKFSVDVVDVRNANPFLRAFYKERQSLVVAIDIRLLYFLDWFVTKFTNFFNQEPVFEYLKTRSFDKATLLSKPDVIVLPYVSCIWRQPKEGETSRHYEGRAIDISGIVFVVFNSKGLKKVFEGFEKLIGAKLPTKKFVMEKFGVNMYRAIVKDTDFSDVAQMVSSFSLKEIIDFINRRQNFMDFISTENEKKKFEKTLKLLSIEEVFKRLFIFNINVKENLRIKGMLVKKELEETPYKYSFAYKAAVASFFDRGPYMGVALEDEVPKEKRQYYSFAAFEGPVYLLKFDFNATRSDLSLAIVNAIAGTIIRESILSELKDIGYFIDASGGIFESTKRLSEKNEIYENLYRYLDEFYRIVIRSAPGKEHEACKNYLIWIGGLGKDYEEIEKDLDTYKELTKADGDVYHLYHIHVSVGKPDCSAIKALEEVFGIRR